MKFTIVSRGDQVSHQVEEYLSAHLHKKSCITSQEHPDLVISVGGDGTFLKAFHRYQHRLAETAFVGVHTGRLGFYADWRPHELDDLLAYITADQVDIVEYPLLEMKVVGRDDNTLVGHLALNESTVKVKAGSMVVDLSINGDHFETFRGDGLCISTPSGSTAYNKSLGGAIVHPSIPSIQVAEMASINNRVYRTIGSPLILPDHHKCELIPRVGNEFLVSVDHITFVQKEVKQFEFQVAQEKIRFVRYRPNPFWERVRSSFVQDGNE